MIGRMGVGVHCIRVFTYSSKQKRQSRREQSKNAALSTAEVEVKEEESQDGEGTTEEIALLFALVGVPPRGCCGCVFGGRLGRGS